MKAAKWRDLSEEELTQKARELSEEIFNLRFQLSMGVAKNPSKIGQARRDLARAYTIQRERGGAPLTVTAPAAAVAAAPAETAPAPSKRAAKTKAAARPAKAAKVSKAAKAPKAAAKKKTAKG
jgi:large subunit ribosomal protein L29